VDAIDADPDVGGLAVLQPPVQALNFRDDQSLRRHSRRNVALQTRATSSGAGRGTILEHLTDF
jgi:hypothetical protein